MGPTSPTPQECQLRTLNAGPETAAARELIETDASPIQGVLTSESRFETDTHHVVPACFVFVWGQVKVQPVSDCRSSATPEQSRAAPVVAEKRAESVENEVLCRFACKGNANLDRSRFRKGRVVTDEPINRQKHKHCPPLASLPSPWARQWYAGLTSQAFLTTSHQGAE